jgi:hypothetical protein
MDFISNLYAPQDVARFKSVPVGVVARQYPPVIKVKNQLDAVLVEHPTKRTMVLGGYAPIDNEVRDSTLVFV